MGLCTTDTLTYTLKITHTSVIRKADTQVDSHTHTHTHTLLKSYADPRISSTQSYTQS